MARSQLEGQARKETNTEDLSQRLITLLDPAGAASEAYRALRTNLLYAMTDKPPTMIVVTSPNPLEGKSTVCANLGVMLAQAGKRTLILDCDFRSPAMHKIFGLHGYRGMVSGLTGEHDLLQACHEPLPGLKVLIAGAPPPNPAELLGSWRLSEFLATAREEFDYVLMDSPPIGMVSDPAILAAQGDGILLTIDAQKTRSGDVRRAVHSLRAVRANILGTVMNNVKAGKGIGQY
jgi:capsular exopolysaccharide synthesis family protein